LIKVIKIVLVTPPVGIIVAGPGHIGCCTRQRSIYAYGFLGFDIGCVIKGTAKTRDRLVFDRVDTAVVLIALEDIIVAPVEEAKTMRLCPANAENDADCCKRMEAGQTLRGLAGLLGGLRGMCLKSGRVCFAGPGA
jgi:hypothetical protein